MERNNLKMWLNICRSNSHKIFFLVLFFSRRTTHKIQFRTTFAQHFLSLVTLSQCLCFLSFPTKKISVCVYVNTIWCCVYEGEFNIIPTKKKRSMWHWKIILGFTCDNGKIELRLTPASPGQVNKQRDADWLQVQRHTKAKYVWEKKNCHQFENFVLASSLWFTLRM